MTPILDATLTGFLVGASLIIAIGAQNAFVLRQGLLRQHIFAVAGVCALSDAVLIAAGVAGLGTLVSTSPRLLLLVTIFGAGFLFFYGLRALTRAFRPSTLHVGNTPADGLWSALSTCLALTWLNPHVYLDTVVLVGSLSAQFSGPARAGYGVGAALASVIWFFTLGYGARLLTPLFARPLAWRVLDVIVCAVMWLIAGRLAWSLIRPDVPSP